MQAAVGRGMERPRFWVGRESRALSPAQLEQRDELQILPERWQLMPFMISVDPSPTIENAKPDDHIQRDPIVDIAINKLIARVTAQDLGNRLITVPDAYFDKRKWKAAQSILGLIPFGLGDRLAESKIGKRIIDKTATIYKRRSDIPRAVIRPGTGKLDLLLDPLDYAALPDPKPSFFYVSAVDHLPEDYESEVDHKRHSADEFEFSRQQLVRAAAHNGVILEVDRATGTITGFWWLSTQGNHQVVRGTEEELLNSLAIRFCVHNGDTFVTNRSDYPKSEGEPIVSWDEWSKDTIHHDLHEMAAEFNRMGLLDDHVDMVQYTPDAVKHGQRISDAINRSDLGEGMYSGKRGKVVAMSPSGGKKVEWSDDPMNHHLTPISHMTATGTVVYTPTGAPEGIKYANGSVEARENIDAYVMRQRYAMGAVNNLTDYEQWQRDELNQHQMIPVYQEDAPQEDFVMVHLHGMPEEETVNGENVEIVEPDYTLYPEVDMACGSMGGNGSLRSALAKSKWFTAKYEEGKHFLEDRVIVVRLRGHGIVMLAKDPKAALKAAREYMTIRKPAELTA